ncbi:MAG: hypothetical protein RIB60_11175 [Phycisphaerales bacterium]
MGSPLRFWQFLEAAPNGATTRNAWAELAGDAVVAIEPLLKATGELATHVPSPLLNAPDLRVVHYPDGALVGFCGEGVTATIPLAEEDITHYRVDPRSLRSCLAVALGLRTSTVPAPTLPGVLKLGQWEPQPQTAFSVVFVAQPQARELRSLVREAVLGSDRPLLVLTPTDEAWDDELRSFLEKHKSVIGSVGELVELTPDAVWAATDTWELITNGFADRAGFVPRSGSQNKRPRAKRSDRLAKIQAVRDAIDVMGRERALLVDAAIDSGTEPTLPKIRKKDIAERAGLKDYHVSTALSDKDGKDLSALIRDLQQPDSVLRRWSRRHRSLGLADRQNLRNSRANPK